MERKPYQPGGNGGQPEAQQPEKKKRGRPKGSKNPNGGRRKGHWAIAKETAISECKSWMTANAQRLAKSILMEEGKLAFSDIRLIPGCPQDIPDEIAGAISSFEINEDVVKTLDGGEQVIRRRTKYTLWPKGQALERLSRQLGLYERDNAQKSAPDKPVVNLYLEQGNAVVAPSLPPTDKANGHG